MKRKKTTDELINEQKEKLKILIEKKEAIEAEIKKANQKLANLESVKSQEKVDELNKLVEEKGLSIEDVIEAIKSGNLL